jgi:hypothetical protein
MRRQLVVGLVVALGAPAALAQDDMQRSTGSEPQQAGVTEEPQREGIPEEQQQTRTPEEQQRAAPQASRGTSDAFERACIDLVQGRTPEGEKAIKSLRGACEGLMRARADERIEAEQRAQSEALAAQQRRQQQGARVEAGRSGAQVQQGEGVLAAFGQAGSELVGARPGLRQQLGMRSGRPVRNTLVTNPISFFDGIGVNAELSRAFMPKLSWVGGARYSTTDATNGTATAFGVMGGVDWFVIGQNNEGLRIGPRIELAVGRETFQGSTTFARLGMSGEVGYNFIAANGVTGMVGGGIGGRIAGDENEQLSSLTGGEFGPYAKIGVGYSW